MADIQIKEISIIIPIYNAERYLDETLSYVAGQTMKDIEIICVDDGSSDDSVQIIEKYVDKDPRFKLLHCPHGGAGKARNMGIDGASGEFLLFLDADDIFESSLCQTAVDRARITGADIVIFGSDGFDDREKKRHGLGHLHYPGYLSDRRGANKSGIKPDRSDRSKESKIGENCDRRGESKSGIKPDRRGSVWHGMTDDRRADGVQKFFEASDNIEHIKNIKPFNPGGFTYQDVPEHIFNAFGSEAWNKLYRHDFIRRHNLRFQELMRTNDMLFTFKSLVLAGKISLEKSVLAHYRTGISTSCQSTTSLYPLDFYTAYRALRDYLEEAGIYDTVRRSFVNYCAKGCYHNIVSQTEPGKLSLVYRFLHEKGFPGLGFGAEDESFFYEKDDYIHYNAILNDTLCEVFYDNYKSVINSKRYRLGKAMVAPFKTVSGAIKKFRSR